MSRYGSLADLQEELLADDPDSPIRIFGVNGIDEKSGNGWIEMRNRELPWLQDERRTDVWSDWDVRYRDLIILDRENRRAAVFNLTDHDLGKSADYKSLLALLRDPTGGVEARLEAVRAYRVTQLTISDPAFAELLPKTIAKSLK